MCRGITDFKWGYQPSTNIVKDEKGDLVTDSPSILVRWRDHFSQLLNIHGVNDVRQTEIHTAEPPVPELCAFEVEISIEKLKSYKSSGIDQIPAKLIEAGGRSLRSEFHKIIYSIRNKEELPEEWKESIIVPIYKKSDKTDCSNYRGISHLSSMYKILSNILLSRVTPYAEEVIGDHQCGFQHNMSTTVMSSAFVKYLIENWNTVRQCISYL